MNTSPSFRSLHHSFDVDLATQYGIEEAIVIHHFQHWIGINRKRKQNFKEGRTWSYQTLQDIADHFPYWSLEEVRTIMDRLCLGQNRRSKKEKEFSPVLLKGNFNKTAFDKTVWYAFVDESKFLNSNNSYERANAQIDKGECPNGNGQMPKPIPDTKTYTKTSSSSTPPKERVSSDPPPNPEEEEELERRFRERPLSAPKVKSKKRWRDSVLEEMRKEKASADSESLKEEEESKSLERNISRAKQIYAEASQSPANFKGRVKIDDKGILSCCTKDKAFGSLSPKVPPIEWESVIESWRVDK